MKIKEYNNFLYILPVLIVVIFYIYFPVPGAAAEGSYENYEDSFQEESITSAIMAVSNEETSLEEELSQENVSEVVSVDPRFRLYSSEESIDEVGCTISSQEQIIPDVSNFTGAATVTIPLVLPPVRGNVPCALNLTYNSSKKNGWLGVGWELDVGSIQRSTKRGVDYQCNDYVIGDNELIPVDIDADGNGEYRVKIESDFTKYSFHTDTGWVAIKRDGTRYYFGCSASSQHTGPEGIFKWCLSKVTDTNGNSIAYAYVKKTDGQIYLVQIEYTQNGSLWPRYKVDFYFVERTDTTLEYSRNFEVHTGYLLKIIDIRFELRNTVRTYQLEYEDSGTPPQSRLVKIRQFGANNVLNKERTEVDGNSLPPITIEYEDEDTNEFLSIEKPAGLGSMTWWKDNTAHVRGDFNGDGKTDILKWQTDGNNHLYLSNGDGTFESIEKPDGIGDMGWTRSYTVHIPGDYNGDGKTDILKWQTEKRTLNFETEGSIDYDIIPTSIDLFLSNGDGTFVQIPEPDGIGSMKWKVSQTAHIPGDYNGDGKTDILKWQTDANTHLFLSNGDGTFTPIYRPEGIGVMQWRKYQTAHIPGDFNGDGRTDILKWQTDANTHLFLSNGDGTFTPIYQPEGIGVMKWWKDHTAHIPGDFNGDGRTDILEWQSDGNNHLLLSKGNGTFECIEDPDGIGDMTWWDGHTAHIPGDFNGDGRTDILKWQSNANTHLFLSMGDGTFSVIYQPADIHDTTWWTDNTVHLADDYNGDGKTDVLKWQANGNNHLYLWNYEQPLWYVKRIENGSGGSWDYYYQPSSQYDNTLLPFILHTVSKIISTDGNSEVNSGNGVISSISYAYSGGLFDYETRDLRGFSTVTRTTREGNSTTTSFHQDEYLKGQPHRTEIYAHGEEHHFSTTDTIVKKEFLDDNRAFVYCESTMSKYWEDVHLPEPAYTIQESYLYDMRNGLATSVISEGPGAETITKRNEYSNYGEWVWRLTKEMVEGSDSGIVREIHYGYENGTGNLLFKEGRLIGEENQSPIAYYDYDSYGNQTTITDARGYATHIEYERTHTLHIKTTFPETEGISHTEKVITYDYRFSTPTETEDENGNGTHYEYDEFGRLTHINFPDGGQRVVEYYDEALPRKIITRVKEDMQDNFSETHTFFDGFGRKIEEITPRGPYSELIVTKWHYDLLGRNYRTEGPFYSAKIEFNQSPSGFYPYLENHYDSRGRVIEIKTFSEQLNQPLITEISYNGLSTTTIDPDGCTKTTIKDYRGRITQVLEYLESKEIPTSYKYNAAGDLIEVIDALNNRTILCYDTLGRKRSMTDPDMGVWHYEYDRNGNLIEQKDPKNQHIWWIHDGLNRLIFKIYSAESDLDVTTYTYDNTSIPNGKGRLSSVSNSCAETIINEYDVMGRIKSVTRKIAGAPSPYTFMYEYDVGGKQTKSTYPDGFFITYSYYPKCGLLKSVTGSDGVRYAFISEYDPLGKIQWIFYGNSTFTEYKYDKSSTRLRELITFDASRKPLNPIQYKTYTYSPAGDILSINDEKRWISYTYEYDTLHRLISERGLRGASSYEPASIIKNFEGAGPLHAPKSAEFNGTTYNFTYDGNGNMTEGPDFSTPDTVGWRTITYNADNMPTEITVSKAGATTIVNLAYDGSSKRVRKTLSDGSEIFYVSDTFEVINGNETKYIYAGPLKVAVKSDEGTFYYHQDHLGSSVIMTNASGGACEEVTEYLPYGLMRTHGGEYVSEYKFAGQERDPEIGLYNYNARLYDPALGMFITPDTVVQNPFDPQMLNRYAYCRNNPVMFVDPSGHFIEIIIASAIIGAVSAGAQTDWNPQAMWEGAFIGAVSGGVGGGVGVLAGGGLGGAFLGGMAAGATAGGVSASMYGGNVFQGMMTGMVFGGIGGAVFGSIGMYADGWSGVALQGMAGGGLAELQGGKFGLGFALSAGPAMAMMGWEQMRDWTDKSMLDGLGRKRTNPYGEWDTIGMRECVGCNDGNQNLFTKLGRKFEGTYDYDSMSGKIFGRFINQVSKAHDWLNGYALGGYSNGNFVAGGQLYNTGFAFINWTGMLPAAFYTGFSFSAMNYQPLILY